MPPARCKRPVAPGELSPAALKSLEDYKARYSNKEEGKKETTSAEAAEVAGPSTSAPIPRLTSEKRRTIQLKGIRQGLSAQAAELKEIRKRNKRVRNQYCRVCALKCNSVNALHQHLESSKHKRHLEEKKRCEENNGLPRCLECQRDFSTYTDLDSHRRGKHHIRHINFLASTGKL